MNISERALIVATDAFLGRLDRSDEPAIFHSLRVGLAFQSDLSRAVGFLHDVVEDTHITLQDLTDLGFPTEVTDAVEALTRREEERYFDYIQRVSRNRIAHAVKIADLKDNMDRLIRLAPREPAVVSSLMKRYQKAFTLLVRP